MRSRHESPRRLSLPLFVLAAASVVAGCGATEDQLRTRAAFDMKCPADQIKIVQIDDRTQGVEGCGERSTYVENCDAPPNNLARKCAWVRN